MARQVLSRLCLLAALLNRASTQSTTGGSDPVVSVLLEGMQGVAFEGSVISAGPTASLYSIDCTTTATTSIPANLCTYVKGVTLLEGPSTYSVQLTAVFNPTSILISTVDCVLSGNTGFCTDTLTLTGSSSTFSSVYTNISATFSPVTITAGANLLSPVSASTTPSSGSSPTSGAPNTARGAATSSTSTAGAQPRVTQRAILAGLAGIAVGGLVA